MRDFLAIPFSYVLSGLYSLTDSYLLSIFLLTLIVRLLLLPSSIKQQKNSAKQVRLNTKVNKIKQKYAGNQQKIQEETQALYQREGFGAANMGCAPMFVQLFVMLGLYEVIYSPITYVLRFSQEKVTALQNALKVVVENSSKNSRGVELQILNKISSAFQGTSGVSAEDVNELVTLKDNFLIGGIDLTSKPDSSDPGLLWIFPFWHSLLQCCLQYLCI